jgi:anti-anti-sigma factor
MDLSSAPEVGRGDHACCVFTSDEHQAQLVGRFANDAFARGDRLFYLADRVDEAGVVDLLGQAGIDAGARLDRGDVQIVYSSQMGLERGFNRDRQLDVWRALIAQARSDGYGGVAAAAEMSWVRRWGLRDPQVVDYEANVGPVFKSGELAALCQYDARVLDEALIERVKHAHPIAVACDIDEYRIDYARLHLHGGPGGSVAIGGEIDLASVDFLHAQLTKWLSAGDVVADCSQVDFVDISGCRLLRRASAGDIGEGRLRLENVSPPVGRVMRICSQADQEL